MQSVFKDVIFQNNLSQIESQLQQDGLDRVRKAVVGGERIGLKKLSRELFPKPDVDSEGSQSSPYKLGNKSQSQLMLETTTMNKECADVMEQISSLKRKGDSRSLQKIMNDTKEHLEQSVQQQRKELRASGVRKMLTNSLDDRSHAGMISGQAGIIRSQQKVKPSSRFANHFMSLDS